MQNSAFKIYNASAGSGKTYTLAKSYLKILIASSSYDQFKTILAITFTNKAVAEMKERIIDMLKNFSSIENLEAPNSMFVDICKELDITSNYLQSRSSKILKHILHNYGAFDISTIDGFTHRIIRTFALDLKLPINFEVELDEDRLISEAVDRLIAKAGTNSELTSVLVDFALEKTDDDKSWDVSYDFNKIAKLLVNETDLQQLRLLNNKTIEDFNVLKQKLKKDLSKTEEEIKKIANETLTLINEAGLEFTDFTGGTKAYLPNYFLKLSKLDLSINYETAWVKNLNDKPLYPQKTKNEDIKRVLDSIQPQLVSAFNETKSLVITVSFIKAIYRNITPLSVLNAIKHELQILKSEQNKLLISEFNTLISNEIKDQPTPFIYERLGEKFKHYFIDEFQDTSLMQWQNLVPLLDNALSVSSGSVMIVGDAKQAIYRWRGGEAEQFMGMYSSTINPFNIEPRVLSLDTNYRSAREIISFNNSFFQFVSERYFNNLDYASLYNNATQKDFNTIEGHVNLTFLEIDKSDEEEKLFAEEVFKTISQCLENGYQLDDICVLVRKRKEGIAVAKFLSENAIQITSSETLLLKNSSKVVLINTVLNLLLQPDNDRLKVDLLSLVADHHKIKDKHTFFLNHLKQDIDAMFRSLKEVGIILSKSEMHQLPLYELVEYTIRSFSLDNTSDSYLQFYLDVVLEFTQKQNSDLAAFVNYYEKKKDKLSIVSPDHINAVQIMTIHKSKGLEFPIVIFPFATLDIYNEIEPKTWFPVDKEHYGGFETFLINYGKNVAQFGDIGTEIYQTHQSQLELDHINLLYVALTRAANQLFIISKKDIDSKGKVNNKTYSGMLISYLQHLNLWDDNQHNYSFGELVLNNESLKNKQNSNSLDFISVPKEAHNLSIITKAGLLWDTTQEKAIERGNLVHLVLSKINTLEDIDLAIDHMITSAEINTNNAEELKSIVLSVVYNPKLNPFYSNDDRIYNERDIITSSGQILRPDRLNINSQNEVVIIDYKTGVAKDNHKAQLYDYESVLTQMNFYVIHKFLVYINDNVEVIEV